MPETGDLVPFVILLLIYPIIRWLGYGLKHAMRANTYNWKGVIIKDYDAR
jgi:hypothetical protein